MQVGLFTEFQCPGFSGLSAWMNAGGHIPHERVLTSMRLFTERVVPRLG